MSELDQVMVGGGYGSVTLRSVLLLVCAARVGVATHSGVVCRLRTSASRAHTAHCVSILILARNGCRNHPTRQDALYQTRETRTDRHGPPSLTTPRQRRLHHNGKWFSSPFRPTYIQLHSSRPSRICKGRTPPPNLQCCVHVGWPGAVPTPDRKENSPRNTQQQAQCRVPPGQKDAAIQHKRYAHKSSM